ncbi:MAG TPA: hypothetical protein DHV12_02110 [Thermotogae bacterium]|nr:hypothetical protein [Thermotogota bacterium]
MLPVVSFYYFSSMGIVFRNIRFLFFFLKLCNRFDFPADLSFCLQKDSSSTNLFELFEKDFKSFLLAIFEGSKYRSKFVRLMFEQVLFEKTDAP